MDLYRSFAGRLRNKQLSGPQPIDGNSKYADNALEVRNLSVRFGRSQILKDLSFTVRRATSLAIVGPNGSGKTVLFRALLRTISAEGIVQWAQGVRIGYVPQKLDIARDVPITGLDFLRARASLESVFAGFNRIFACPPLA